MADGFVAEEFYVLNLETGRVQQVAKSRIAAAAFSPDGARLAYIDEGGLRIASTTRGRSETVDPGATSVTFEAVVWLDSKRVVYSMEGEVRVYDLRQQHWRVLGTIEPDPMGLHTDEAQIVGASPHAVAFTTLPSRGIRIVSLSDRATSQWRLPRHLRDRVWGVWVSLE
jgi:hypothetical protein